MSLHRLIANAISIVFLFICSTSYAAINSGTNTQCSANTAGGEVVVLICNPGLTREAMQVAGQQACQPTPQGICNAWIWDDINNAPSHPLMSDIELTKAQVQSANAVWVNDAKRLIILKHVVQN